MNDRRPFNIRHDSDCSLFALLVRTRNYSHSRERKKNHIRVHTNTQTHTHALNLHITGKIQIKKTMKITYLCWAIKFRILCLLSIIAKQLQECCHKATNDKFKMSAIHFSFLPYGESWTIWSWSLKRAKESTRDSIPMRYHALLRPAHSHNRIKTA